MPEPVRPLLFDISRLIWRVWKGQHPTGIDRVCLAYMARFGANSQAMIQWRALRLVLSPRASLRLYALLQKGGASFRRKLPALLATGARPARKRALSGQIYLNVGHTGLDAPGLGPWLLGKGLKPVFLVHDLIPITHPRFCRNGENERHAARMRTVLDYAAGIIANSAATRDALTAFAGRKLPPCVVALLGREPLGREPLGREPLKEEPAAPPATHPRPYFVVVGTIEGRKNHILLLRVWERLVAQLGERAPDLIVIGQRGWQADAAIAALDRLEAAQSHVHELNRCDDKTMAALVKGARALLMPSHIEGYGLPVVEALQRGTPVIASDLAVYRELAGDIPLYLDPDHDAAWENAVLEFAGESAARRRQLAAMRDYTPPDWDNHFSVVEALLARVRESEPSPHPPN